MTEASMRSQHFRYFTRELSYAIMGENESRQLAQNLTNMETRFSQFIKDPITLGFFPEFIEMIDKEYGKAPEVWGNMATEQCDERKNNIPHLC